MSYVKYRNTKTTVDGITFDSAAESRRYKELKLLEQCGVIKELSRQHVFEISPPYTNGAGKKIQKAEYWVDFKYFDCDTGKWVFEDVKRPQTATVVYKLKKKLVERLFYPIVIIETDA